MPDQVFAEGIRVPHEVAKRTCGICTCLLLLVLEKINEELDTRPQMLVQDLVMEASITHGETGELASVAVGILAALDSGLDQPVLEKLLIEVASVAAQIADKVADFRTDARIIVANQRAQVSVDVRIVDRLIEFFRNTSKLRYQTQSVDDKGWRVLA